MVSLSLKLLLSCLGCQAEQPADPASDSAYETPSSSEDSWPPLPATAVEEGVPHWDLEALAEILAMVEETGFPDPRRALAQYIQLMQSGDEDCPGHENMLTDAVLYGCTASTGYYFSGITEYSFQQKTEGFEVEYIAGDFLIQDPSEAIMEGGGHIARWMIDMGVIQEYGCEIVGSWIWTADPGWMQHGSSSILYIQGTESEGEQKLTIEGGWGIRGVDMHFQDIEYGNLTCAGQPEGTLRFRDPDGFWYTWTLDGCSECGPVEVAGESLGELCVDWSDSLDALIEDLKQ